VVASVAIPPLYKDVERRGTAFWDGLFSINTPVNALTGLEPKPQEIWIVQINPQRAGRAPGDIRGIADRRNELGGNISLNKELDTIEAVNEMLGKGLLSGGGYRPIAVRIVGLEEHEAGLDLTYASKFDRSPGFLRRLFDLGRERAPVFYGPDSLRDQVSRRRARSPLAAG
jgi:NTE family protein